MAEDKRKGKVRKKIRQQFKEEIRLKRAERKVVLDQLALLDAQLDGIDEVIQKIDKKIPPLVDEINAAVDAVKAAYDARITNNARSGLVWELQQPERRFGRGAQFEETQIFTCVETPRTTINKVGVKYYKKEQDRDYGTNVIKKFVGIITAGHDVMAVVNSNPNIQNIKVGDFITDSFLGPETFVIGNLPEIVGIGTTSVIRIVGKTVGSIEAGSVHFANTGIGSTSSVPIGHHLVSPGTFSPNTTVVGFGTTTVVMFTSDPVAGVSTAYDTTVETFILNQPALVGIATDDPQIVDVGITSTFPSFELDKTADADSGDRRFVAYRFDKSEANDFDASGPDEGFNYQKSPIDPIEIGLISNSTRGFGHKLEYVTNGDPDPSPGFESWESQRDLSGVEIDGEQVKNEHPEPEVGGGKVSYQVGTNLWPTVVNNGDRTGGLGALVQYATLNQTTGVGAGATSTVTSQTAGYSPTPPQPVPTDAQIADMDDAITAAESALNDIRTTNGEKINKFITKSETLRKVRDELQLRAWGLLQAAAYSKGKIKELKGDRDKMDREDLDEFDPD